MVIKNDLGIVRRVNLSSGYVFIKLTFGVYINDFTVPFVSEKKAGFSAPSVDLEIGRIV